MRYTRIERDQIAEAFSICKRYLAPSYEGRGGKEIFICFALGMVSHRDSDFQNATELAGEVIRHRLGCFSNVDTWLNHELRYPPELRTRTNDDVWTRQRCDLIQAYRHRWVDALIEEFIK